MTRGFSLIELMIAMLLAGIVASGMLMVARGQIVASELNDQVTRAQQNGRAGLGFAEAHFRRSCGGISLGRVGINVPGAPQQIVDCVRVWDGATPSGGTFIDGTPAALPDAVELIYGAPPVTVAVGPTPPDLAALSVNVADLTGFAIGDLVLLGDLRQALLVRISSISAEETAPQGRLVFAAPAAPLKLPDNSGNATDPILSLQPGATVMKAQSISFYVESASGPFHGLLMYDPDGVAGASHDDAQPLVEGVEDFQIALGADRDGDGVITESAPGSGTDEWIGNTIGELPLATTPWNRPIPAADPQLREIRVSLVVHTNNTYPGLSPVLGTGGEIALEDRTTYPSFPQGGGPRYRVMRIRIAPRVWNLTN